MPKTNEKPSTAESPNYTKYPKLWLKCYKCQAFVSASPYSVFRYIAKLLKVELDALNARYAKVEKAREE